jgi:hypothetical protein
MGRCRSRCISDALRINDVSQLGVVGSISLRIAVVGSVTFGLAALSKRFLEDPFLGLKRYLCPEGQELELLLLQGGSARGLNMYRKRQPRGISHEAQVMLLPCRYASPFFKSGP